MNSSVLLAFLASFAFALVAVFFFKKKAVQSGNTVVLVGPSDAGKTAIFSQLKYGQSLPSHTSLQVNETVLSPTARLVDVPGHPRIREQFSEYLPRAKGVVFVVDASMIARNGAVVAEHLHNVLYAITQLPPSVTTPSLLILAHKSDAITLPASSTSSREAVGSDRVRTVLERELEKRRHASVSGVGVGGLGAEGGALDESEGSGAVVGGLDCSGAGTFAFERWEGGAISFAGSSVKTSTEKGGGLGGLETWLDEL